jgi:hypothetical protein
MNIINGCPEINNIVVQCIRFDGAQRDALRLHLDIASTCSAWQLGVAAQGDASYTISIVTM